MAGTSSPRKDSTERGVRASQLTLDEKVRFLSGKTVWDLADLPRLGIETITVSDGPHGIRKGQSDFSLHAHPATCFPTGSSSVCSWNPEILHKLGEALAEEAQSYGISVVLGPGMNLKRHPAGGRNLEYLSEDPFLNGRLAAACVRGVQSTGKVGACPKHFAVNNQESNRFVINSVVDERTLRELYLKHFEMVAKDSQPALIMGAYNKLNGIYCCENKELLTDILRTEWGYRGALVTDWTATNHRPQGIEAGLDLEMPGSAGVNNADIQAALHEDRLSEPAIDECVDRVLNLIEKYPKPKEWSTERRAALFEKNHGVAKEIALESIILLKNDNNVLPVNPATKVAVIGEFAKEMRYQGMGSSNVEPTRVSSALDALQKRCGDPVPYARGYDANSESTAIEQSWINHAVETAKAADTVLLFLGLPEIMESEGFDRETLELPPQQLALLEALTLHQQKIVIILSHGGVVLLPDTISKVSSILDCYLFGQAGGEALAELICGVASPSGRLPETIPMSASHVPSDPYFPGDRHRVEYREGLQVGYRYYDSQCSFGDTPAVRYPFGHGLTYSTFEYAQLQVEVLTDETNKKVIEVEFQLQNTGSVAAKEVVQCYVAPLHASVYRPSHELKFFAKVALEAGESQSIMFKLSEDDFSTYDIGVKDWIVEPGAYEVQIGASSQNILLQREIRLETGRPPSKLAKESYPASTASSGADADFAKRFGHKEQLVLKDIEAANEQRAMDTVERNSLMKEAAKFSMLGSFLLWVIIKAASSDVRSGPHRERDLRLLRANIENIPLRALVLGSTGKLSFHTIDALIALMNSQWHLAISKMGAAIRRWIFGHPPLNAQLSQGDDSSVV